MVVAMVWCNGDGADSERFVPFWNVSASRLSSHGAEDILYYPSQEIALLRGGKRQTERKMGAREILRDL